LVPVGGAGVVRADTHAATGAAESSSPFLLLGLLGRLPKERRERVYEEAVRLAASSAEVRNIVSALYVSPEGLAANMRASSQVYAPPDLGGGSDTEDALQAIAFEALSDKFTTHEEVLHAAQLLAATGIAAGACGALEGLLRPGRPPLYPPLRRALHPFGHAPPLL
jgi:hypothetical protein